MKIDFTRNEVDVLILHLGGLCALYEKVNSSGSGPLPSVLRKIKQAASDPSKGEGKD